MACKACSAKNFGISDYYSYLCNRKTYKQLNYGRKERKIRKGNEYFYEVNKGRENPRLQKNRFRRGIIFMTLMFVTSLINLVLTNMSSRHLAVKSLCQPFGG